MKRVLNFENYTVLKYLRALIKISEYIYIKLYILKLMVTYINTDTEISYSHQSNAYSKTSGLSYQQAIK